MEWRFLKEEWKHSLCNATNKSCCEQEVGVSVNLEITMSAALFGFDVQKSEIK